MPKAIISDVAKSDINQALRISHRTHGVDARKRYRKLITGAIRDIEKNVTKGIGVEEWKSNIYRYHLRNSRDTSFIDGVCVKNPSHYIFFEVVGDEIRVLRLLYETREFHLHL